ncbi:DUF6913 domain-containing protein [Solitalea lacus]|uniref:DUF6913 domain-containing protein n=1 Tax=Solitalea lacus TaxID=2911172 RepID=UPI001EDA9096|nr:hypothetical protein [Solitalea lacus]UKJ06838.1 hypothetical protein L2B55_15025 [Solitalea lacus]
MKQQLTNYFLKKAANQTPKQGKSINLEEAGSFLFLFSATSINEIKAIKSIVAQDEFKQKKITTLGVIDAKDLPEFRTEAHNFSFITNKDLNLLNLPKEEKLDEIQSAQFDVLINLAAEPNKSISYLALKANAGFKISKYQEEESFVYDFMINCKKDTSIVNFTAQVLHYLSLIK